MRLGREYLEVVLRLGKLVPGWVESYVGPPTLVGAVDASRVVTANELRARVEELRQRVGGEEAEPDRRAWLGAQLSGISTALLWLGGQRFGYAELFELCHDAPVELVPDERFRQAHALLDSALPGGGDVAARYRSWRDTQLIPRERLHAGLELLSGEMRRRCRESFDLPYGEQVRWELVSNRQWGANANYLGQLQTLIRINADLPISSSRLLEIVCHEAYPGHHCEHVCKDASLLQSAGREELAVYVYPTPQALISEGLASYGVDALLGDEADRIAAGCLRPIGIPYDHETASVVREAATLLLPVRSNITMMLHDGATAMQARDYARTWMLEQSRQIDNAIAHLKARSWPPYESCYPVGLALCRRYTASSPERFRNLLHQQLTPADIDPRS